MSGINEVLISDARGTLVRKVGALAQQGGLDEAFAAWLLPTQSLGLDLVAAAVEAESHKGAARSYRDVAVLGFHADIAVGAKRLEALENGLRWLAGCPSSVNDTPLGVSVDAIAVLGVALGARCLNEHPTRKLISDWMGGFIYSSYGMRDIESWQKCLFAAAQRTARLRPDLAIPDDDEVADVYLALFARGLIEEKEDRANTELQALHYLKSRSPDHPEAARLALSLAAHNTLLDAPLSKTMSEAPRAVTERKIKILFLAADPINEDRLRLGEEVREIETKLRQSAFPNSFVIDQEWAVRISDLQSCLLRHQPDIVHFSGHGSPSSEIVLEDSNGNSQVVPVRALEGLFSTLKDNIRCIVLNACHSEPQAEAIAQHIECVVGMSKAINDKAAISFAASFYQALAYGRSVGEAHKLGCNQIHMENLSDKDVPRLLAPNADPDNIFFVARA
jgi:CHAT domain-containing protein